MKKIKYLILGLTLVLAGVYIFLFNMRPNSITSAKMILFDKNGFVDANTLSNTNRLVSSNDIFELYIDETTSYFWVKNKETGVVWESNPSSKDPWETDTTKTITNSALDNQKSTLILSYFNQQGSKATINNYKYSIYHPKDIENPEGLRTFDIKYTTNGVQILYYIEDLEIDYLYFPKYLPKEFLEGMDESIRKILEVAYTGFDETLNAYSITQYENMSKLVRARLYKIFYQDSLYKEGFTREQAIEENKQNGYTSEFEKVYFEVAIDITLTENGINTTIINESIVEGGNLNIANIALLPLFGTAVSEIDSIESKGYIVIPDGSGAILEFNNGKYYQQPYSKRLYGEDLAILSYKMSEQQQKISIPLYGMVKEKGAFAAIITEGDAMATINADVSGRVDSYNKAYVTFNLRENELITLGSGFSQYAIELFTEEIVQTDFKVEYTFLDENSSYVDIAKVYKEYLINNDGLSVIDNTNETVLTTEFLGAYRKKAFFLGTPYYSGESLTTFDNSKTIIDELWARDIKNMNIKYSGIYNGGLRSSLNDNAKVEKVLGGEEGYDDLVDYLNNKEISLYPTVKLMTTSKYNKLFDQFRYTSRRIDGDRSLMFTYHLPSKLPYSETPVQHSKDDYVISPDYYQSIFNKFDKDYEGKHISLDMMGSIIAGNYNEKNLIYKEDAIRFQRDLLSDMNENVMLSNPLGFAFSYASYITDLPTETTLYPILDYSIPLLQLVLSGYVDYSTESINLASERSTQYNFLKVLETGSNLKYTLSYDDSKELTNTELNYYMSTHYVNWLDEMEEFIKELNSINLHEGTLIGHERLENNVIKVTYSNNLEIIINYNLNDVVINNQVIEKMNYIVLEVK